jgi:hypothetical protein
MYGFDFHACWYCTDQLEFFNGQLNAKHSCNTAFEQYIACHDHMYLIRNTSSQSCNAFASLFRWYLGAKNPTTASCIKKQQPKFTAGIDIK